MAPKQKYKTNGSEKLLNKRKIKCYPLLIPKRTRLKQCKQLKYQKRVKLMNYNLFPKINMYLIEYFQPLFRRILAPELPKVT